jgi:hypothetical protein
MTSIFLWIWPTLLKKSRADVTVTLYSNYGLNTTYPDRFSVIFLSPSRQILG